jgi:hypothetical protein
MIPGAPVNGAGSRESFLRAEMIPVDVAMGLSIPDAREGESGTWMGEGRAFRRGDSVVMAFVLVVLAI